MSEPKDFARAYVWLAQDLDAAARERRTGFSSPATRMRAFLRTHRLYVNRLHYLELMLEVAEEPLVRKLLTAAIDTTEAEVEREAKRGGVDLATVRERVRAARADS